MKKIAALIMVVMTLLASVAYAEGACLRLSKDPKYLEEDTVCVDVEIVNNPGIAGIMFYVDIDPDKALLLDYEMKDLGKIFLSAVNADFDSGILFAFISAEDNRTDGAFVTLKLRLLNGASLEKAVREIKIDAENTFNDQFDDVFISYEQ